MASVFGLDLKDDLYETDLPIDVLVIVKYLRPDGDTAWLVTTSESLTDMEALGMLRAAALVQEQQIINNWNEGEDDGD